MKIKIFCLLLIFFAGCAKEEASVDIASMVIGDYIGDGKTSTGADFEDKELRISRLSNTRIKVEPINGNTSITGFDTKISLNESPNGSLVISVLSSSGVSLVVSVSGNPVSLGFENFNNGEEFSGIRQ